MVKRRVSENVNSMTESRRLSMFLLGVTVVLTLVLKDVQGKEVCPKMCTCDVFEGYKRADCR